jgi:hypothetical protein
MNAITVKRTIVRRNSHRQHACRFAIWRPYLTSERKIEFAIEALFFGIIVAISLWPLFLAAGALGEFLQQGPV